MVDKSFIFLAGHHRSGTSLLHEILRAHPLVSGFSKTGVPQDEGQHLQSVFKPALAFGGPGKYIYNQNSYMNEHHSLATEQSAKSIWKQWSEHYNKESVHYIEKSPPNLIRTRFLQKLFPNSKFVCILRHPLAVSYATQKWSKTSIESLIEHTLLGYEILMKDIDYLSNAYVIRYEEFTNRPQREIDKIYDFLGLKSLPIQNNVRSNINEKYFAMWDHERKNLQPRDPLPVDEQLEKRTNTLGYSIANYRALLPSLLLGAHGNKLHASANSGG